MPRQNDAEVLLVDSLEEDVPAEVIQLDRTAAWTRYLKGLVMVFALTLVSAITHNFVVQSGIRTSSSNAVMVADSSTHGDPYYRKAWRPEPEYQCEAGDTLVTSKDFCRASATALGLAWQGFRNTLSEPKGCWQWISKYENNGMSGVYFNEHVNGKNLEYSGRHFRICQKPPACAWRQTGSCRPTGYREPASDALCTTRIKTGSSGFCDCNGDGVKEEFEPGYDCFHGVRGGMCSRACEVADPEVPTPATPASAPAPAPQAPKTYTQLFNGRFCGQLEGTAITARWLSSYTTSPEPCMHLVLSIPSCSHEYFSHATNGDGNCACVTRGLDCSRFNHVPNIKTRVYRIKEAGCALPSSPKFVSGKGKGCPSGKGSEGCLNGNFGYSTLSEAWRACGDQRPECGNIMFKEKSGKFYLRRSTDLDRIRPDAKMYTYQC